MKDTKLVRDWIDDVREKVHAFQLALDSLDRLAVDLETLDSNIDDQRRSSPIALEVLEDQVNKLARSLDEVRRRERELHGGMQRCGESVLVVRLRHMVRQELAEGLTALTTFTQ